MDAQDPQAIYNQLRSHFDIRLKQIEKAASQAILNLSQEKSIEIHK